MEAISGVYQKAARAIMRKYKHLMRKFCEEELIDEGWMHMALYPLRDMENEGALFVAIFKHLSRYVVETYFERSLYIMRHHPEIIVMQSAALATKACEPWEAVPRDGEFEEVVCWCLRRMNGYDRKLIQQHILLGMQQKDMAAAMGVSNNTLQPHIASAKQTFRQLWLLHEGL